MSRAQVGVLPHHHRRAGQGRRRPSTSPCRHIPELLALYRRGDLLLRELITRTYTLNEVNQGYADLNAGHNLRGVVVF